MSCSCTVLLHACCILLLRGHVPAPAVNTAQAKLDRGASLQFPARWTAFLSGSEITHLSEFANIKIVYRAASLDWVKDKKSLILFKNAN